MSQITISTGSKNPSIIAIIFVFFVLNFGTAHSSEAGIVQLPITQIDIADIDLSHLDHLGSLVEDAKKEKKEKGDDELLSAAASGAAPGISYFQIFGVQSSNVGWEQIYEYQTSTNYDHGGSQLAVAVFQVGYGSLNQATLNGLARSPFYSEGYCYVGSWRPCNPGETIQGWVYAFSFDGQQNGQFTASAHSTSFPFDSWSDSINIQ